MAKKKAKVVSAAGVASGTLSEHNRERAAGIEAAMVAAVKDCAKKGITNPKEIRKAMLDAREKAR